MDKIDPNHKNDVITYMGIFRWLISQVFITIPHTIICIGAVVVNYWFNITMNKGWADGNLYLFLNTLFLEFQAMLSIILVMELPSWLKRAKFIRVVSFVSAIVWLIVYGIATIDFAWRYVIGPHDDFISMMIMLYEAYNFLTHATAVFPNAVIIIKEITLEFFHLWRSSLSEQQKNSYLIKDDDYRLGIFDFLSVGQEILTILNPMTYINGIQRLFRRSQRRYLHGPLIIKRYDSRYNKK